MITLVGPSGVPAREDARQARVERVEAWAVDRRHVAAQHIPPSPPEAQRADAWLAQWREVDVGPTIVWRWIIAGERPPWWRQWPWHLLAEPWMEPMSAEWIARNRRTS